MRIHVLGDDSISQQARTYAEYRVFGALAQSAERVRGARVVLRSLERDRGVEGVICALMIDLDGSGALRIHSRGDHAYAAINRAVERLRTATEPAGTESISS